MTTPVRRKLRLLRRGALYALAALLLAPWVCAAALVLGFLFKYGIRFEKDAVKMN